MPEYIERSELLEDIAESVVHTVRVGYPSPEVRGANKVIDRIKSAPVADVVEVVRCKDCEDYNGHRYCEYHAVPVLDDDFCSYGHKEEGAEK